VVEPGDWDLGYCLQAFKRPISQVFKIEWTVAPQFVDEFAGLDDAAQNFPPPGSRALQP
jgi:hypothetical protein